MNTNPYQSPQVENRPMPGRWRLATLIPLAALGLLTMAVSLAMLSIVVPPLGAFVRPRFGWIGLLLSCNTLIFLSTWYKRPTAKTLVVAASMAAFTMVINGTLLFVQGTVAEVKNDYIDRLHSAWLWSVLSFGVLAALLYVAAYEARRLESKAVLGENAE